MNCPYCGQTGPDTARFCRYCGHQIPRCSKCGKILTKKYRFCPNDGTPVPPEMVEGLPDVSQARASKLTPRSVEPVSQYTDPGKRKKSALIPIATVFFACLLLAGIVVGVWMMKFRNTGNEESITGNESLVGETNIAQADDNTAVSQAELEQKPVQDQEQVQGQEQEHEQEQQQQQDQQQEQQGQDLGNDTVQLLSSMQLGPISQGFLQDLPKSVSTKEWDTKRRVQGVEWNTDTMDTVYFSVARYIAACNTTGEVKKEKKTDGYFFSMDYYNGHLFCVWRSDNYGRFKLKVLNPSTLEEENSVSLPDLHKKYEQDEDDYGGDLCASIDGVVVAPRIGSQDELMVYVSYNSYVSKEDGIARNAQQTIYEYSYEEAMESTRSKLTSKRRLRLDLGEVEYGIQTLELDRSTGNIWCAIRQGYSDYSLYLIDSKSQGSNLSLIPNGSQSGWDCPEAGDGLCSLGYDEFYLLIPNYNDEKGSVSVKARRASLGQLEGFQ